MGLEKAIQSGKEHRKPYTKGKAFDPHCRNNNWCPVCKRNRLYQFHKGLARAKSLEEERKHG